MTGGDGLGLGAEKGRAGAHTAPVSAGAAGGGAGSGAPAAAATKEQVEQAARDLAAELAAARPAGGDQADMFDDETEGELPDVLPIGGTRSRLNTRRGRGRPKGAANKRTREVRDYLLRQGYTHPMEALASLASATVTEVVLELGAVIAAPRLDQAERAAGRPLTDDERAEAILAALTAEQRQHLATTALGEIRRAAVDLLPYFESKRPVDLNVNETRRHLLVVGQIPANVDPLAGGMLSLTGGAGIAQEYQQVEGEAAVCRLAEPTQDEPK